MVDNGEESSGLTPLELPFIAFEFNSLATKSTKVPFCISEHKTVENMSEFKTYCCNMIIEPSEVVDFNYSYDYYYDNFLAGCIYAPTFYCFCDKNLVKSQNDAAVCDWLKEKNTIQGPAGIGGCGSLTPTSCLNDASVSRRGQRDPLLCKGLSMKHPLDRRLGGPCISINSSRTGCDVVVAVSRCTL